MSVMPSTSNTARIGPPAMMPVPRGAGAIITVAAPWWPVTLWWMVPFLSETLQVAARLVHGLLHGGGHFLGLALAHADGHRHRPPRSARRNREYGRP
jgi:hypothetical protein